MKKLYKDFTPEQKAAANRRTAVSHARKGYQTEEYRSQMRRWRSQHRIATMTRAAKVRAGKQGVPYDLDWRRMEIPVVCPILGIELEIGTGCFHDASPSIDRIRPGDGYTMDNVRIISWLANRIKSNVTDPIVFRKIADYVEAENQS